jgi:hypothetical protein
MPRKTIHPKYAPCREVEFYYVRYVRDDGKIFWGEIEGTLEEVEAKVNSEAFVSRSKEDFGYISWEVCEERDYSKHSYFF